jgi:predicted metal-dependent peptidase
MKSQSNIEWKLTRARTQLVLNQPFFGALCLRLKLVAGPVPTMSTDGRRILYNPAFVEELTPAELEGVLAHEVSHCALGHPCRRGKRDAKLWNVAADYAINPILVTNGFTLPPDVLIDPAFSGLSAEEIYARLLRSGGGGNQEGEHAASAGNGTAADTGTDHDSPLNSDGQPPTQQDEAPAENPAGGQEPESRPGGFGEVLDATDDEGKSASQADRSRQQQEWNIAAEQAMRVSKACGREPAGLERPLSENRLSKQDWRARLREFVAATTPSDYRWTPPNRRYVASGIYLPSVMSSGVGTIVIGVDTSGSIGSAELEQFAAEISAIADEAKPESIHVVYCDAAVQASQEFGPSEPVELKPKGGGGTDFRPVFEWVEHNAIQPACLIYLTDLCCDSYPEPPRYPVLWVTDSRRIAPFGETLRWCLPDANQPGNYLLKDTAISFNSDFCY